MPKTKCTRVRKRARILKWLKIKGTIISQYGLVSIISVQALLCGGVSRLSHRIKSYHNRCTIHADTHVSNMRLSLVSCLYLFVPPVDFCFFKVLQPFEIRNQ